jgi:GT2 family glycosyltransferase
MNHPLVSIITINFDHPEVTCRMLESLEKITYPSIEVIVVDNASPNDDPGIIEAQFPEVTLVRNPENLGFAGGNNVGIRMAKGKYILLLNNDTEVDPGFLEPLVRKLEANTQIGAVSPQIRFFDHPDTLQFAGSEPLNPYTMRSHGRGYREVNHGQFDHDSQTPFVHGACMLVPREVIRQVGLMAECFFLYYEELDWGYRIRKAGYELWYIHDSVIYHKESISTGKMSPLKVYYMNRARLLYMRRNVHGFKRIIAVLFQAFISFPKNVIFFTVHGKKAHRQAYVRSMAWHLQNMFKPEIYSNPVL